MQMAVNNGVINQINSKSAPLNESACLTPLQQTKPDLTLESQFSKIIEQRGNICMEIPILQNHGRYMRKVNI